ncbi:hypothetical protein MAR_026257 [Mya arenaria]|uniref:Uncharacterized protein n=1 Tax=Mya arenaria TaxID=6604 RepID=A0ABY7ESG4_MYAAR|nr:hypothetical protein MAR_026257 [Mya arenaria]
MKYGMGIVDGVRMVYGVGMVYGMEMVDGMDMMRDAVYNTAGDGCYHNGPFREGAPWAEPPASSTGH